MHAPDPVGSTRRVFDLGALGALVALGVAAVARVHRERRASPPRRPAPHLRAREGEGGGVPVGTHRTAAQVEPRRADGGSDATADFAP
jgi:hypothetical protein